MKRFIQAIMTVLALTAMSTCFAFDEAGNATSIGDVSQVATGLIFMTTNLMSVCFFLIGIGFTVNAVVRFRSHFKNPTVVPLMTPIIMSLLAVIMFSFNAFNTWKQNEVFRGSKPPALHIHVPNYNPNASEQIHQPTTPLQALRDMQNGQTPQQAAHSQLQPAPAPAPAVVSPSMPNEYDPDFDDDDDEEYAT